MTKIYNSIPYFELPFGISDRVRVIVMDDNDSIVHMQKVSEYLKKPDIKIAMASHGSSLLDILTNEEYLTMV